MEGKTVKFYNMATEQTEMFSLEGLCEISKNTKADFCVLTYFNPDEEISFESFYIGEPYENIICKIADAIRGKGDDNERL